VLTLANAIISLQTPEVIRQIFNYLDPGKPMPFALPQPFNTLGGAVILIFIIAIIGSAVSFALGYAVNLTGQRFLVDTRSGVYEHLQTLS